MSEKIIEPMKTLQKIHEGKSNMNKAFIKASLNFRKPQLTNKVSYGSTKFEYADLSEILDCVTVPLLKEGFFIKHDFYNEGGIHWIKTYLEHESGNTLGNVVFPMVIKDKTMQQIGAQITYLKRYSISSICNIIADSDNDGKEVVGEKLIKTLSPNQAKEIKDLLNNNTESWDLLKKQFGYSKITDILSSQFETIATSLRLFNIKNEAQNEKSSI